MTLLEFVEHATVTDKDGGTKPFEMTDLQRRLLQEMEDSPSRRVVHWPRFRLRGTPIASTYAILRRERT